MPKEERRRSRPPSDLELWVDISPKRRRTSKNVEEEDGEDSEVQEVHPEERVRVRPQKAKRVDKTAVNLKKDIVVDKGVVRMEVSRELYDFSD